ncbi:MAG: hypothetical protein H6703_14215 [Myxococcales bacterium]|nr:hypothetical protein [Myxococcales bacterium]
MKRCVGVLLLAPLLAGAAPGPTFGVGVAVGPGHIAERVRVDLRLQVLGSIGAVRVGGELVGAMEGDEAGIDGCGPPAGGGVAPAIAEACLEPSLALHGIVGRVWGDVWTLRLEAGVGVARLWRIRGDDVATGQTLSWVGRAVGGVAVGDVLGAIWRIGPAVEVAGFGAVPRWGGGLVLEATSYD